MFKQKKLVKLSADIVATVLFLIQGVLGFESSVREVKSLSQGEKIVFLYDISDTEGMLSVINTDGSSKVELGKGNIITYKVSPDKNKLAYSIEENGLWIINSDSTGKQQLTTEDISDIEWAKDSEIIYISYDEKNTKINIYNLITNTNKIIFEGKVWEK